MSKVIIIDYKSGNLFSVQQALKSVGLESEISSSIDQIQSADAVIFPGMGAFGTAMENLRELGIDEALRKFVKAGNPFLGVCLGMQLLFSESDEFGNTKGLDIIKGKVSRFPNSFENNLLRVPQIAWNRINSNKNRSWIKTPLELSASGEYMYFVHSYFVQPSDSSVMLSKTTYGDTCYTSSLLVNNIFACQFHPEKSGEAGLKIYKAWATQNKLIK